MTKIVIGSSENTEAEYSSRSDAPFSLLILTDDEVTSVEGYATYKAAKAAAKAEDCPVEAL